MNSSGQNNPTESSSIFKIIQLGELLIVLICSFVLAVINEKLIKWKTDAIYFCEYNIIQTIEENREREGVGQDGENVDGMFFFEWFQFYKKSHATWYRNQVQMKCINGKSFMFIFPKRNFCLRSILMTNDWVTTMHTKNYVR